MGNTFMDTNIFSVRESLCGLKALSELYEGGTENPTVQGLMADFDEAADGFLE